MSSYIEHRAPSRDFGPGFFYGVSVHGWEADLWTRLTWLYGSPDARIEANRPDVARWNALGLRAAA